MWSATLPIRHLFSYLSWYFDILFALSCIKYNKSFIWHQALPLKLGGVRSFQLADTEADSALSLFHNYRECIQKKNAWNLYAYKKKKSSLSSQTLTQASLAVLVGPWRARWNTYSILEDVTFHTLQTVSAERTPTCITAPVTLWERHTETKETESDGGIYNTEKNDTMTAKKRVLDKENAGP